jgi:arabinofuranosyltransferase
MAISGKPVRGNCEGEAAERTKRASIRLIYSAMPRRAPAFVLGLAALVRAAAGVWLGFRPFDDTYITFRYSLNLASGNGFVYNVGEPVLGTTAPLWAMVLALAAAAGAPIEHTALAISLACDAASAFLLFRLLTLLGLGEGIPLAGALLFLGIFDYFSLARSGMESSFFVFLVLGSLGSVASRRFTVAALFTALAILTRPEGGLLLVVFAAALW